MRKLFFNSIMVLSILLSAGTVSHLLSLESKSDFTTLLKEAEQLETQRKYDSALLKIEQAMLLTKDFDSLFKAKLMKGNQYRLQRNFDVAIKFLSEIDHQFESGDLLNDNQLIEMEYLKGKIFTDKGEYTAALEWLQSAAERAEKSNLERIKIIGRVYNYLGIAYHFKGEYQFALRNYIKAQKSYVKKLKGHEEDLADVLLNIGIIHSIIGQFDSSFFYMNQSLLVREQFMADDALSMAAFYTNYGSYLTLVGEVNESIIVHQKAEKLLAEQSAENGFVYATLLINMGNTYQLRADFERALIYYHKAIHTFESIVDINHPHIITATNNIAFVYNQLGRFAESLTMSKMNLRKDMKPVTEVKLYRNISQAYKGLGNDKEAEEYLALTLRVSSEKIGENHYEHAVSLIDFADFLRQTQRFSEAIPLYQQARRILALHFGFEYVDLADVMRKQAYCMAFAGNKEGAVALFSEAEDILAHNDHSNNTLSGVFSLARMRLSELYADRAEAFYWIYRNSGNTNMLESSHQDYERSLQMLDVLGVSLTDESRLRMGENSRRRFSDAIAVAYELYKLSDNLSYLQDAYRLMGGSKAAVLLSTMRRNQAFVAGGVPDEAIESELKLRQEVLAVDKLITEERQKTLPNLDRIKFLQTRQFSLMKQYDGLLSEIEVKYPAYYSLRYNPEVIQLDEARNKLGSDEALVEYCLEDSLLHIIAFSKEEVLFLQSKAGIQIQDEVKEIRQLIFPDFSGSMMVLYEAFGQVASSLYQKLIQPVDRVTEKKRLTIVPDGLLGYLPFEILLFSPEMDSGNASAKLSRPDFASLPYLFTRQPVTYSYSSTHRFASEQPVAARKRLLAVVPDYENSGTEFLNAGTLAALPYALEEARAVLKLWKGDLLHADEAKKEVFLELAPEYQLLHFGMHTVINDENPMLSRFAFSNNMQASALDLTASELYGIRLNASMVVLSACNTGSGQRRLGEGIMNLTRGFIFAGVPSIVMTNWEVNDQSGARLMELFYDNLYQGMPKDIALQQARINYLDEANMLKAHPFFWAAYQLVGDPQPLNFQQKSNMLLWIAVAVFLIGFVAWLLVRTGMQIKKVTSWL